MELLLASALGIVTACGVYLILRGRTFSIVLGLSLLGYAVNLFIFAMGRLTSARPPVITEQALAYADPLPQALVLTAIVIGFGMTGFIVELALRTRHDTQSDHVDGQEPGLPGEPVQTSVQTSVQTPAPVPTPSSVSVRAPQEGKGL